MGLEKMFSFGKKEDVSPKPPTIEEMETAQKENGIKGPANYEIDDSIKPTDGTNIPYEKVGVPEENKGDSVATVTSYDNGVPYEKVEVPEVPEENNDNSAAAEATVTSYDNGVPYEKVEVSEAPEELAEDKGWNDKNVFAINDDPEKKGNDLSNNEDEKLAA